VSKPASNSPIPPELRRKTAPAPLLFAPGERIFIKVAFIGFATFWLYGPIPLNQDHNVFLYLLGPWVCPSIPAAFFTLLPPLPSRGTFLSRNWRGIDRADPAVMRLVELYKSGSPPSLDPSAETVWDFVLNLGDCGGRAAKLVKLGFSIFAERISAARTRAGILVLGRFDRLLSFLFCGLGG